MLMRLVEFQDWHTLPPSDDDDDYGGGGSGPGSGDSNYNGYWPGFSDSGGAGARPRRTRYGDAADPRLGRGSGPRFLPRQQERGIMVGLLCCPVVSSQAAMPYSSSGSRIPGQGTPRVAGPFVEEVDFIGAPTRSHSPIKLMAADPMCVEASLCKSPKAVPAAVAERTKSIDQDLRPRRTPLASPKGAICGIIDRDFNLLMGRALCFTTVEDGPSFLYEPTATLLPTHHAPSLETELYLSGPDEALSSRPLSPRLAGPGEASFGPPSSSLIMLDHVVGAATADPLANITSHVDEVAVTNATTAEDFVASFRKPLPQSVLLSTPRR